MFWAPMPNGGPAIGSLMTISYQSVEKRRRSNQLYLGDSTTPAVRVSATSGFKARVPPVKMLVCCGMLPNQGLVTEANGPEAARA